MSKPLLDSAPEPSPPRLPADLPLSTVSEITSWLVGHRIHSVERELILHTLDHCSGNRAWTASILGISPRSLEQKLRGYARQGIAVPEPYEDIDLDDIPDDTETETAKLRQDNEAQSKRDPRWIIGAVCAAVAVVLVSFVGFRMLSRSELPMSSPMSGREISILGEAMPVSERNLPSALKVAGLPTGSEQAVSIDREAMPVSELNLPRASKAADLPERLAARLVDIEQDTRMDSAPVLEAEIAPAQAASAEKKEENASALRADSVPYEPAAVSGSAVETNIPQVVHAAAPVEPPAKSDVAKPTEAAPETTASIDPLDMGEPLVFDEPVPLPPRRPPPRPVVQARPAQPAQTPATAETPSFPLLFPFNLFPKGNKAGAADTGSQSTR